MPIHFGMQKFWVHLSSWLIMPVPRGLWRFYGFAGLVLYLGIVGASSMLAFQRLGLSLQKQAPHLGSSTRDLSSVLVT